MLRENDRLCTDREVSEWEEVISGLCGLVCVWKEGGQWYPLQGWVNGWVNQGVCAIGIRNVIRGHELHLLPFRVGSGGSG